MSARTPSLYSQDDPLSNAIRPPTTETDLEKKARLQREAEARRISEQIDEDIRQERERIKKSKEDVKLLLLGQAESGKSTLQKQFKLMYKPDVLESERNSWRMVVYYNVLCSIKHILATLDTRQDVDSSPNGLRSQSRSPPSEGSHTDHTPSGRNTPAVPLSTEGYQIANLRLRLSPFVAAESQLADLLTGGVGATSSGRSNVLVRSDWQVRGVGNGIVQKSRRTRTTSNGPSDKGNEEPFLEDIANMLDACKHDIQSLWEHTAVKTSIASRRLRLEAWATYFLDNIMRISARDYIPTTDDILHARIQTMGVVEDSFDVNIHGNSVTWRIYDVGGARGQRHAWAPYFDDINSIIFVAPVSAFDQYLDEDPATNRIEDSLHLFTQICANPLLKAVHLVLFLSDLLRIVLENDLMAILDKTDLLQAKLAAGVQVKKYIISFGDRPNDFETVLQYFRAHFLQVHRKNNEKRRVLYTHFTSVINTKATQNIIGNVRDSIFRGYLQSASLV